MQNDLKHKAEDPEKWLEAANSGHCVVTTPLNFDSAEFERLRRIYAEGEPVTITGNAKVFQP
ncbi:hypothetical protein [Pseudomonas sp.]|uniref:hypothetical protein n=1 Tax=Pseudomonas sp. TaxID=306 RepID=UPI0029119A44|nr:hypothetical protein [Pseudomonas sp.]MDU4254583.1 hypothetical protein [Pseudomonas sp.]